VNLLLTMVAGIGTLLAVIAGYRRASRLRALTADADAAIQGRARSRLPRSGGGDLTNAENASQRLAQRLEETRADLRDERERFRAVLEGMDEGVLALSPDGRIVLTNRAAVTLLGCAQAPLGRRLFDVARQPGLQEVAAEAARRGPGAPGADAEVALPGGRALLVHGHAIDRAGLSSLLVLRDVTALRHLELLRRDFIANASHELRTPTATLLVAAEALCDGAIDDPAVAHEFAATVLGHARRLSDIVSDLLDLSRIEAGRADLKLEAVPLAVRLRLAATTMETLTLGRHQTVTWPSAGAPVALANAAAIDQILLNLLDNASKYAGDGARIELSALANGAQVRLQVADDGPGIAAHQRERVFERFYRVDPGRSRAAGGTGLGLAIVRHLSEAMGGSAGVEANRPRGAVFWVALPAAAADAGGRHAGAAGADGAASHACNVNGASSPACKRR